MKTEACEKENFLNNFVDENRFDYPVWKSLNEQYHTIKHFCAEVNLLQHLLYPIMESDIAETVEEEDKRQYYCKLQEAIDTNNKSLEKLLSSIKHIEKNLKI